MNDDFKEIVDGKTRFKYLDEAKKKIIIYLFSLYDGHTSYPSIFIYGKVLNGEWSLSSVNQKMTELEALDIIKRLQGINDRRQKQYIWNPEFNKLAEMVLDEDDKMQKAKAEAKKYKEEKKVD